MPLTLSSIAIEEKNRLATDSVWLVALEIVLPGVADPVRIVGTNEDVTWRGETWTAFPFEIEEIADAAKSESPRVDVRVGNVSRVMEAYLAAYDAWTKQYGYAPVEVLIYVLNSANLASPTPEVEHVFELKQPRTDSRWATFTLGASNPFNRRFPQHRILRSSCRYAFKGTLCGYAWAETACNKTLTRCRELGNSERFGGAPGVGYGGLVLV